MYAKRYKKTSLAINVGTVS